MNKRNGLTTATVSIDVDPIDAHLAGYGYADSLPNRLVYERAIPRVLDALARHEIRATFFWVARDAAATAPLLRTITAAGHELASHTVSHPEAWRLCGRSEVARELRLSKQHLEQASGTEVVGFRSPGWHSPKALAEELAAAGYRYDASSFPSPFIGLAGAWIWARSAGRRRTALGVQQWFSRRHPHALGNSLHEFPVSVTRLLRFPVYHTLRYSIGDARFERILDRLSAEAHPLSYPLHAVDALGWAEDSVDSRLRHHPGMDRPLRYKTDLLDRTFAAIRARFAAAPHREVEISAT